MRGAETRVRETVPPTVATLARGDRATGWTALTDLLRGYQPAEVVKAAQRAA